MVYSSKRHLAIIYGGWNGHKRFDDVWCLDMESWRWTCVATRMGDGDDINGGARPPARTDHASSLWLKSTQDECMLVFGGSLETGAGADLWSLDCSDCPHHEDATWSWERMEAAAGPWPPPRTSHASAIAGIGEAAALVIVGGQDSARGTGAVAVLADAWILAPLGSSCRNWSRLEWEGVYPLQRCRHCISIVQHVAQGDMLAIVYGGYDGVSNIDEHHSLFAAPLSIAADACEQEPTLKPGFVQERWSAGRPIVEEDLPEDERALVSKSRRPLALAKALHRHAMKQNPPHDTYIDPASGYSVFTQAYLKRRPCCGNGCRHCPHGHINVPANRKKSIQAYEW